jgi:phospholipid-translocating ATPase
MAISAALVANMFTGFSATVWTWWFLFAVAFGLVVQWGFTVRVLFLSLTAL